MNLVERDGRTYGGTDGLDLHAKVAEHLDDAVLVGYLLLLVDVSAVVLILLEQVEGRVFVSGKWFLRIDWRIEQLGVIHRVAGGLFLAGSHGDVHSDMMRSQFGSLFLLSLSLGSLVAESALLVEEGFFLVVLFCDGCRSFTLRLSRLWLFSLDFPYRVDIEVDDLGWFRVLELLWLRFFLLGDWFGGDRTISSIGVSLCDGIVLRLRLFILAMVGNLEMYLAGDISHRVECLSDDGDGLRGEIGEEGDGCEEEDGGKTWRTDHVLQVLHDEDTMLSTWIVNQATHERGQELGECDGCPYHHDHRAQEPLPQVDLVGVHQLQST